MDTMHVSPSAPSQGAQPSRQKPGAEAAQGPGAFLALLTGLQDPLVVPLDAPVFEGAGAEGGEALGDGFAASRATWPQVSDQPMDAGDDTALSDASGLMGGLGLLSQASAVSGVSGPTGGETPEPGCDTPLAIGTEKPATSSIALGFGGVPAASVSGAQGQTQATTAATEGLLAAGGLVAQTARLDAASDAVSGSGGTGHAPSLARRAPGAALADRVRASLLAPEAAGRRAAQGSAVAGSVVSPRTVPDQSPLQQVLHRAVEAVRTGSNEVAGAAAVAPMAVAAGALGGDARAGKLELFLQDRPGAIGAATTGVADASDSPFLDAAGPFADGLAASPEEAIAEQVTYWLSENLKNAELTVDHAGQPVEVRVSLSGNEAHVAFRSDQAQTRALLDARMEDLRQMLHGEGLVLSGASVDAGASGQAREDGGKRPPERARTATVAAATDAPGRATSRTLATGSVDLYV